MRRALWSLGIALAAVVLCTGGVGTCARLLSEDHVVRDDTPPAEKLSYVLADDRVEDKHPAFDPAMADRRPLGDRLVNASGAVVRLDIDVVVPEAEAGRFGLHPTFAAALAAAREQPPGGRAVLPSANLVDAKGKQFDDGLYAALDEAYYRGLRGRLRGHVDLVRRLFDRVGAASPAAPFLAAGLGLAGEHVAVTDDAARRRYLDRFEQEPAASRPVGFYTWDETLAACFRFLRFFQQEFPAEHLGVPMALAGALRNDPALLADYRRALDFYARLTNPAGCLSVADLHGLGPAAAAGLSALAAAKGVSHPAVALFPASGSREVRLFERLFPLGLPPNADLMEELIRRVRSGEVDLRPGPGSGWYDHQVYALEALVLPERAEGHDHLLLTKAYKERLREAFRALLTKRRETHVRQLAPGIGCGGNVHEKKGPPGDVAPRLRVEPCPGFYLRTARAYAFLANFLEAAVGADGLRSLHGLREGGRRPADLHTELRWMRDWAYGLYLVSAEDIGLQPAFLAGEAVDRERCYRLAEEWLGRAAADPDLAVDARVVVPIYHDLSPGRMRTRMWGTVGVRLAQLDASYLPGHPPRIRPRNGRGDWQEAEPHRLAPARYLIAGEEFVEVEAAGVTAWTRAQWRALCDAHGSREAIRAAAAHQAD